ncbi:MAG: hypothetical protein KGM43_18795, partial [Planctomycetota bacterium]|nr:hypothetical protein [Planctomycetota bacterium]
SVVNRGFWTPLKAKLKSVGASRVTGIVLHPRARHHSTKSASETAKSTVLDLTFVRRFTSVAAEGSAKFWWSVAFAAAGDTDSRYVFLIPK